MSRTSVTCDRRFPSARRTLRWTPSFGQKKALPANARCVLEKVDMLSFHGVTTTHSLKRKSHVHQLTISPLRYRRLPLCAPGLRGRFDPLSHRATTRAPTLLPLRLPGGLGPGRCRTLLPNPP